MIEPGAPEAASSAVRGAQGYVWRQVIAERFFNTVEMKTVDARDCRRARDRDDQR
jgi:hypothetical protein